MPHSQPDKAPQRMKNPLDLQQASVLAIEAATSMISPLTSSLHALRFGSVSVLLSSDHAWQRLLANPPLQPDLILIDWHVHPTPCEEFLRRLRRFESPRLAKTPVICLIANADAESVCAARDAGANAVLARPFSPKQLGEKVLWVLEHDVDFIRSETYVGPDRRHFRSGPYRGKERRRSVQKKQGAQDNRTPA
jgi:two-component system, chemotaxis family, chemotaxis protein CheY